MRRISTWQRITGRIGSALFSVFPVVCPAVASDTPEPTAIAKMADTVITNGRIYTLNPARPWAQAVAIADGRYLFVGDAVGAAAWVGEGTQRVDLGGAMAMPGINDAHSHPWQGGLKTLYSCNFDFEATPGEVAAVLRGCLRANPGARWSHPKQPAWLTARPLKTALTCAGKIRFWASTAKDVSAP